MTQKTGAKVAPKPTPAPKVSGATVPAPTGWTAKRLAAQKGGK
jgi:hypothetical protein